MLNLTLKKAPKVHHLLKNTFSLVCIFLATLIFTLYLKIHKQNSKAMLRIEEKKYQELLDERSLLETERVFLRGRNSLSTEAKLLHLHPITQSDILDNE